MTTGSAAMQSVQPHPTCGTGAGADVSVMFALLELDGEPPSSPMHDAPDELPSPTQLASIGSKDEHPMHQTVRTASIPCIVRATRTSIAGM